MSDYKKLISSYVVSDFETSEAISVRERTINLPKSISFLENFSKVFYVVKESMTDSEIGKFFKLTEYLDYFTNRLVDRHVGKSPKPLKQIDISKNIKCNYDFNMLVHCASIVPAFNLAKKKIPNN